MKKPVKAAHPAPGPPVGRPDRVQCRAAIAQGPFPEAALIDDRYDPVRRHSTLGHVCPMPYERCMRIAGLAT